MEQPNKTYMHVFPILRFDLPVSQEDPQNSVMVVKVFSSRESAEKDAERLNRINADKSSKYVVYISRFSIEDSIKS